MKSSIPLNAFSSVTVRGLIVKDGASLDQTFHRGVAIPGHHAMLICDINKRPGGIPPRPQSLLPPPGDMHLEVSLGEELGSGRAGSVRAAIVLSPNMDAELPQLVIKISHRKRSKDIAQEAWFYEELEQLQGISIPRCYGFFQVRLEEGSEVSTRNKYWDDSDDSEEEEEEEEEDKEDLPGEEQLLSVLVLERLGSHMPIGQPIDPIIKDVYELFEDVARFGIEPIDIRYDNILSAREGDAGNLSGVVCPNHGHVHHWRLVDFDRARKTDGTVNFTVKSTGSWLRRLFRNLVVGCVIEPWD